MRTSTSMISRRERAPASQITRYYDERRENERPCHHRQLELFVDDDVAF